MTAKKMIQPNTWSFRSGPGNPGARIFASRVAAGHPGNYVENYRIRRPPRLTPAAEEDPHLRRDAGGPLLAYRP
ncbi:hypothetical protein GCM10022295_28000 [Streptomyces osmaniensis]|uniref:Uncharacterized protein n=1 Tax=Streptomyces osmaniensis TaxID=593134 RepID=A0ABP6W0K7_9ACTN